MVYSWRHVLRVVAAVLLGLLAWRAYQWAYAAGRNDCALAQATAAHAAADRARADAQRAAAVERAALQAGAAAHIDQLRRRNALERDIARRPAPAGCSLDAESVELLNRAVRAGNAGVTAAADELPGGLPASAGADGREPARAAALDP